MYAVKLKNKAQSNMTGIVFFKKFVIYKSMNYKAEIKVERTEGKFMYGINTKINWRFL